MIIVGSLKWVACTNRAKVQFFTKGPTSCGPVGLTIHLGLNEK